MDLHDAQPRAASYRIEGDATTTGARTTPRTESNVEGGTSLQVGRSGDLQDSTAAQEEGHFPLQQQPGLIPLECRTRLLTQAANLTTQSRQSTSTTIPMGGIVNEVTPPTAALESPSSPPIAAATSPATLSVGSPSSSLASPISKSSSPTSKAARKRGVPHIYRDFTHVPDMSGYVRKKTGGVTQPFPEKLHEMLDNVNEPSVVGWLPHGRAFIVRKPKEFTSQIMPKFFRQTKLTSFQRQLNLYGFRRLTQGADAGAYYHELFLRGRPQLCMRMQRQKVKGTGHKQPADAKTEPNFYSMESSTYASPPIEARSPEMTPTMEEVNAFKYEEMSPGMQGLHGAAHLLKNIAAGVPASSMARPTFSLGESALSVPLIRSTNRGPSNLLVSSPPADPARMNYGLSPSPCQGKPPAKSSPPTMDGSMSLLGRVNMDPAPSRGPQSEMASSPTTPHQQSAFFWPPIRRTQESTVAAPQGIMPHPSVAIPQQQESAQTSSSSSQANNEDQAADQNVTERSKGTYMDTSGLVLPSTTWGQQQQQMRKEEGTFGSMTKIQAPISSFPGTNSSEDSGPMETKVSNGIETEEV